MQILRMEEYVMEEKLTYSIREAAKASGLSVSYLYRLSSEGKLPVCKIGSRVLVLRCELDNFLRAHMRVRRADNKHRQRVRG